MDLTIQVLVYNQTHQTEVTDYFGRRLKGATTTVSLQLKYSNLIFKCIFETACVESKSQKHAFNYI